MKRGILFLSLFLLFVVLVISSCAELDSEREDIEQPEEEIEEDREDIEQPEEEIEEDREEFFREFEEEYIEELEQDLQIERYSNNNFIVKFKSNVISGLPKKSPDYLEVDKITFSEEIEPLILKHDVKKIKNIAPESPNFPSLENVYLFNILGEVEDAVVDFRDDSNVEYANLDYKVQLFYEPNDPLFPVMWSLNNVGQSYPFGGSGLPDADIDFPEASNLGYGTEEIIVAVIDTGVDYNHEDLAGNMWVNTDELNGVEGYDDDENGYVDDVYGYDFSDNDADPLDYGGHGTHVAGTIAAVTDNDIGISGICPNCKIMALKFFPNSQFSNAIESFVYAVDNGAKILSNSWGCENGCSPNEALENAVEDAYNAGALPIFAAGNDNTNMNQIYYSPTSMYKEEKIMVVAATDSDDEKTFFSNTGSKVDISAPGLDILSLRAEGTDMYCEFYPEQCGLHIFNENGEQDDGGNYYVASGTSMSAPHVAGLAGLKLSHNSSLNQEQVYNFVKFFSDNIYDVNQGYEGLLGYGRINSYNTLQEILSVEHNLILGSLILSDNNILLGNSISINANIINSGIFESEIYVDFMINEELIEIISISSLDTFENQYITLSWTPQEVGIHDVSLFVYGSFEDEIIYDNNLSRSLIVWDGNKYDINESNYVFDCSNNNNPTNQPIPIISGPGSNIGEFMGISINVLDSNLDNITIKNCLIVNWRYGIFTRGDHWYSSISNLNIINNTFVNTGHGILDTVINLTDSVIADNYMEGAGEGIEVHHPFNVSIMNNYMIRLSEFGWLDQFGLSKGIFIGKTNEGAYVNILNNYVSYYPTGIRISDYGIEGGMDDAKHVNIQGNFVHESTYGISTSHTINVSIVDNILDSNTLGILFGGISGESPIVGSLDIIQNNNVIEGGYGIIAYDISNLNISDNTICYNSFADFDCSKSFFGYGEETIAENIIGSGNVLTSINYHCNGNGWPVYGENYLNCTPCDASTFHWEDGHQITSSDDTSGDGVIDLCKDLELPNGLRIVESGITLDCKGHKIKGNNIQWSSGIGFEPYYGIDGVTIKNCVFEDYFYGIAITGQSDGHKIINNTILDSVGGGTGHDEGVGIYISSVNDFVIFGNTVINNSGTGIYVNYAGTSYLEENISNNLLVNNDRGIYLIGIQNGKIFNNIVKDQHDDWGTSLGISLRDGQDNELNSNQVYDNTVGIWIWDSSTGTTLINNIACENNRDLNCDFDSSGSGNLFYISDECPNNWPVYGESYCYCNEVWDEGLCVASGGGGKWVCQRGSEQLPECMKQIDESELLRSSEKESNDFFGNVIEFFRNLF